MPDIIRDLGPWLWVICGIGLLVLEILVPGNVLVWFGLAALVTGGIAFLGDIGWQGEALIFVALAVVFLLAGRRFFARFRQEEPGAPVLNERGRALVGRSFVLAEPIVTGQGRIRVDDTTWRIAGPDLPSGVRVVITGADGAVLTVRAAD